MARKRKRRSVNREERVKPPPEARQHQRVWPMSILLIKGASGGGIDADEFEAALQIVETFKAFTSALAIHHASAELVGLANGGHMSDRDAERVSVWLEWSMHLPQGLPTRLVREIEDEEEIRSVPILRHACRLWDKVRGDRGRSRSRLTTDSVSVLTPSLAIRIATSPPRPVAIPTHNVIPHTVMQRPGPALHARAANDHAHAPRTPSTRRR
jgi:hypothetical protein